MGKLEGKLHWQNCRADAIKPANQEWAHEVCGGVVQLLRTPACHAGSRSFESRRSRHSFELAFGLAPNNPPEP